MVCALTIVERMNMEDFQKATIEERIEMIRIIYEKYIEKKYRPFWKENWEKSIPLLKDFVMLQCRTTNLLKTDVTRGKRYTKQLINIEPISHNKDFVTLLIAIFAIWDNNEYLHNNKINKCYDDTVQKSINLFIEEHPNILKEIRNCEVANGETIIYYNLLSYPSSMNRGGINMRTETYVQRALIY